MTQTASRTFNDFMQDRIEPGQGQYLDDLDALSVALKNGVEIKPESHLEMLQDIMEKLSQNTARNHRALQKTYEFAELYIDAMKERQGYLHTCLRHIAHADGEVGYAPKMEEKMSSIFSARGMLTDDIGQFLDIHKDGRFTLNSWGQEILERLNDRQLLAACKLSADANVPQIHTLKDVISVEQERLYSTSV